MPWVRFPIWDKWGDLTRFWVASEIAISSELGRWGNLPALDLTGVIIKDPTEITDFKCSFPDFMEALSDSNRLYSMLLLSYTGLVEEHARNTIEYAISEKNVSRNHFPGMDIVLPADEAAEKYIKHNSVEVWGGDAWRCPAAIGVD